MTAVFLPRLEVSDPVTLDLGDFARALIISLIERQPDPSEKKAWIMIAYEHGHLTADEAESWIVLQDLVNA